MTCDMCLDLAEVRIQWYSEHTGSHEICVCGSCAAQAWNQYKSTCFGQTAVIKPIYEK